MTNEEFNEMLLAPNCTDCNGLTADDDGEWKCVFQGKRTTEDCYGTDYCCMLYLTQKYEEDEEDEDEDYHDYCDEAAGDCDTCEITETCDDAYLYNDDDDEDVNSCECNCEECTEETETKSENVEELKPVEQVMGD